MSRATVELDFFGLEKENSNKSEFQRFLVRQRSFRGIQNAISRINPELIKSVIANGSLNQTPENHSSFSVPSTPKEHQSPTPVLPVYTPISRPAPENGVETAPMTIFYNGTVSVFDVPRDKAASILKFAVENYWKPAVESGDQQQLLENLDGDLPIARRKSLQRFLEKRKER